MRRVAGQGLVQHQQARVGDGLGGPGDGELGQLVGRGELSRALLKTAEWGARVTHPGVARVLEVGRHEGSLYAVSELVEGKDLAAALSWSSEHGAGPSEDRPQRLAVPGTSDESSSVNSMDSTSSPN